MKAAVTERVQPSPRARAAAPEPSRSPARIRCACRIEAAGVCSTDLHAIDGGLMGPAGNGHSPACSATRTEAAWTRSADLAHPSVTGRRSRARSIRRYSCGVCVNCRRGFDMHCEHHRVHRALHSTAGFTEYLVVGEREIVPLPGGVDPVRDVAPHSGRRDHRLPRHQEGCPPRCCPAPRSSSGPAASATSRLQLARELGGGTVLVVDPHRAPPQARLGARRRFAPSRQRMRPTPSGTSPGPRRRPRVLDFVGIDETHAGSLATLARQGSYSVVGFGGTITLPSVALVGKRAHIVANLVGCWTDLWELVQLHPAGSSSAEDRDPSAGVGQRGTRAAS